MHRIKNNTLVVFNKFDELARHYEFTEEDLSILNEILFEYRVDKGKASDFIQHDTSENILLMFYDLKIAIHHEKISISSHTGWKSWRKYIYLYQLICQNELINIQVV